jgi:hypothetical protein
MPKMPQWILKIRRDRRALDFKADIIKLREAAFEMLRDHNLCALSESCDHTACRHVHEIIVRCNLAQNTMAGHN